MISSLGETSLAQSLSEAEGPGGSLRLGDVDNTGDTVASPNYGSRVEGHVVNLGDGGISEHSLSASISYTYPRIDIETSNSHNYSLEAGAVLNIHTETDDNRIKVLRTTFDLVESLTLCSAGALVLLQKGIRRTDF